MKNAQSCPSCSWSTNLVVGSCGNHPYILAWVADLLLLCPCLGEAYGSRPGLTRALVRFDISQFKRIRRLNMECGHFKSHHNNDPDISMLVYIVMGPIQIEKVGAHLFLLFVSRDYLI